MVCYICLCHSLLSPWQLQELCFSVSIKWGRAYVLLRMGTMHLGSSHMSAAFTLKLFFQRTLNQVINILMEVGENCPMYTVFCQCADIMLCHVSFCGAFYNVLSLDLGSCRMHANWSISCDVVLQTLSHCLFSLLSCPSFPAPGSALLLGSSGECYSSLSKS